MPVRAELTPLLLASRNNGKKSYGVAQGGNKRYESIMSGSFVKYLIKQYGIDEFEELWIKAKNSKTADVGIFQETYLISLEDLSNQYIKSFLSN